MTAACNSHDDYAKTQEVNGTYTRRSEDVLDLRPVPSG